jgi:hypothetical protein
MYSPIEEGRRWRPSWNNELYSLYDEPNIVEGIKIRRLGWAGRKIRMEEERIPKNVLNGNFHTTRPVRRPRTRWADVVQRDALQLLGISGWKRAENRDQWRRLMRLGLGPEGAVAPYMVGWMEGYKGVKGIVGNWVEQLHTLLYSEISTIYFERRADNMNVRYRAFGS